MKTVIICSDIGLVRLYGEGVTYVIINILSIRTQKNLREINLREIKSDLS